jgi:predicted  nucleic acid-binding Zn-ribbon protein
MTIQNILKKHHIKIRGLASELFKSDDVKTIWKTVAEYATTNQGLQTTVKALQTELDRQKLRANELQIRLNEANGTNQKLSAEATDERQKTEWMERKVLVLKNRVEELEDHAVNHHYSDDIYTQ